MHSGNKDDRALVEPGVLPNQTSGLKAVRLRHAHIEQNHRETFVEKLRYSILSRRGAHALNAQSLENGFIRRAREAATIVPAARATRSLAASPRVAAVFSALRCAFRERFIARGECSNVEQRAIRTSHNEPAPTDVDIRVARFCST